MFSGVRRLRAVREKNREWEERVPKRFEFPPSVLRADLTPSPAPVLRERGDLGSGLGIVDRRRRRIATATLTSPPSSPAWWARKEAGGKMRASSHSLKK